MLPPRPEMTWLKVTVLVLAMLCGLQLPAYALKPIVIDPTQDRIDITTLGDLYESHSDSLQVETAPGADGTTDRISVPAATAGTSPNWMVFALTNPTETAIERWITADRYTVVGSGAIWPDLDARRIEAVTPSMGFAAERIKSDRADVYRITIEPGQTITYVVELASDRFARINLWKPLEYELKVRDRQLFNGIMLGLTGLLAIFLTSIFAANHKLIFPASALVAWCVLANLSVDFGFFHKLFQLRPEDNAIYRAAAEAALASSLLIFAHTFLRLGTLPALIRMIITVWMGAQLSLIALAVIDPRLAATFARLSFAGLGLVGAGVILWLALRGQDRAMSLVPTWVIFCVWLFGAAVVLAGRVTGDIAVSSLVAGLVLVLLLIGFTVTQFAFRSREGLGVTTAPNELQMRSVALDGSGAAVWEWNARRDAVKVGHAVEDILDLPTGHLSAKTDEFIANLHPADRERFKLMLWSIQERSGGKIRADVRLRHGDNSYRWFEIEAASIVTEEDRHVRCIGLIRDVTDAKRSQERLLHDAVHDNLTQLPNRALFVDRLKVATTRAQGDRSVRPTLFFIDVDKFKSVNATFGLVVGDSLLLTLARRLQRHLGPHDTLARVGGDQFAILSLLNNNAEELASLAERIRRSLRAPIKMSGEDIVLTGSVGVAVFDANAPAEQDLMKDGEVAMYRAKRGGADRIEIFKPEMRGDRDERVMLEAELRKALDAGQLKILYQPVYYLPTEELAGFEAIVRWEHPKQGLINPAAIVPMDDSSDLVVKVNSHVLMRAARDATGWQKEMPRGESPLFVSVNITSRQLFRQVLVQEVRHIFGQNMLPPGALKLELPEALVMENPEQASEILEQLRSAGAELSLDDVGAGYTSLAYLNRFPFDTIKISHSLVEAGRGRDGDGAVVVRSLVAMARELEKKVVADGVEADEDAAFLRSIGCEFAQGYFYGDAIPERDVISMLRRVRTSERRMKPRSLFRPRPKKKRDQVADVPDTAVAASEIRPNGAGKPRSGQRQADVRVRPSPARGNGPVAKPAMGVPAGAKGEDRASGAAASPRPQVGNGGPPPLPANPAANLPPAAKAGNGAAAGIVPPPLRPLLPGNGNGAAGANGSPPPLRPAAGGSNSLPTPVDTPDGLRVTLPPPVLAPQNDGPPPVKQQPPAQPQSPPLLPERPAAAAGGQPPGTSPALPQPLPPGARPNVAQPHAAQAGPPQRNAPPTSRDSVPPPMPSRLPSNPMPQRPVLAEPIGPAASNPPPIPAAAFNPAVGPQSPPSATTVTPLRPAAAVPDFSKLPPAIAESLARLAGVDTPPRKDRGSGSS